MRWETFECNLCWQAYRCLIKKSWSRRKNWWKFSSWVPNRTSRHMQTKAILFTYSRHLHVLFSPSLECSIHIVVLLLLVDTLTTIFRCQTKLSFLARLAENKQQHLHTLLGFIFRFYVASSYRAKNFLSPPSRKIYINSMNFSLIIISFHCGYKSLGVVIYGFDELRKSLSIYFYYNHRRRSASRASFWGQPIRSFSWCRVRRSALFSMQKCSLLFCQWLWNSPTKRVWLVLHIAHSHINTHLST